MDIEESGNNFKRPLNKKKKGKKQSLQTRKSTNAKWYNNHLPHSIVDCTWLDNTEFNINLMIEKNNKLKEERKKKRSESKAHENE